MDDARIGTMTATAERIRQAGDRYLEPHVGQEAVRRFGRILSPLQVMEARRAITPVQAMAGRELEMYLVGRHVRLGAIHDPRPGSHRHEMRELWPVHCANEVARAMAAVGDRVTWLLLVAVTEGDRTATQAGLDVGVRKPMPLIRAGLDRLAEHYGFGM